MIVYSRTNYLCDHRDDAGFFDSTDTGAILHACDATIGAANFNPDADLNSDGTINSGDIGAVNNVFGATGALPGQLSSFGNTVGYSGYVYDDATNLSLARFRWYDADTGRWATRDPLETRQLMFDIPSGIGSDGPSSYQYVRSRPIRLQDPAGLIALGNNLPPTIWPHPRDPIWPWPPADQSKPSPRPAPPDPRLIDPGWGGQDDDRFIGPSPPSLGNCYRFATCTPTYPPVFYPNDMGRHNDIPGGAWRPNEEMNCQNLERRLQNDGLFYASSGSCPPSSYPIVPVTRPFGHPKGPDFHFYRQECDGSWSDKPGYTPPRNRPSHPSDNFNNDGYTEQCQTMCVPFGWRNPRG